MSEHAKPRADHHAHDLPAPLPAFIILLADHGEHLAGRVLKADADLIAMLDAEHAKYRAATETEISIGNFGG